MQPAHEAQTLEIPPASLVDVAGYQIGRKIGAGGMAEVFRAVATGPGDFQAEAAIKCIRPCFAGDDKVTKMFLDEARLVGLLAHPNIVKVFALGTLGGQPVMVMELVKGVVLGTLCKRLFNRMVGIWPDVSAEIVRQITQGLSYAHERTVDGQPLNLVHRDISPGNVMIADSGTVKILDFGIARLSSVKQLTNTDPGHIKGKWGYMAPEQIAALPIDQRTDVFSCGILLHELLSGRRLFAAPNLVASAQLVRDMPIPKPSQINPMVSEALDGIVLRALERDPEKRWPSAAALGDAIEGYLAQKGWRSSALTRILADLAAPSSAEQAAMPAGTEPEAEEEFTFVDEPAVSAAHPVNALTIVPAEETPSDLLAAPPADALSALAAVASVEAVPAELVPPAPVALIEVPPPRASSLAVAADPSPSQARTPAPAINRSAIAALRRAIPSAVAALPIRKRIRYAALAILLPVVGWSSVQAAAARMPRQPRSQPEPPFPPTQAAANHAVARPIQDPPPAAPPPRAAADVRAPAAQGALVPTNHPSLPARTDAAVPQGHWLFDAFVPRQRHRWRRLKATLFDPFSE